MNKIQRQGSFDTTTMVSVKSNTKFFKAVKEEGFSGQHLSMPVGAFGGINVNHMPLNQIPFRLTQHPHVPFTISASESALYHEFNTKERERMKKEKIEKGLRETQKRVNNKVFQQKETKAYKLGLLEKKIRDILKKAVKFSLETNMLERSSLDNTRKTESDKKSEGVKDESHKIFYFNNSTPEPARDTDVDFSELKGALKDKQKKAQIVKILDKIIEEREKSAPKEEVKSIATPDFNYNMLQRQATLYGIPPRDFEAYIPLLTALHLENYDRNEFDKFNMIESLKVLRKFDQDKLERILTYGLVNEVMKVEERKAIRRHNKEKEEIEREERRIKEAQEKIQAKFLRSFSPFVRIEN